MTLSMDPIDFGGWRDFFAKIAPVLGAPLRYRGNFGKKVPPPPKVDRIHRKGSYAV